MIIESEVSKNPNTWPVPRVTNVEEVLKGLLSLDDVIEASEKERGWTGERLSSCYADPFAQREITKYLVSAGVLTPTLFLPAAKPVGYGEPVKALSSKVEIKAKEGLEFRLNLFSDEQGQKLQGLSTTANRASVGDLVLAVASAYDSDNFSIEEPDHFRFVFVSLHEVSSKGWEVAMGYANYIIGMERALIGINLPRTLLPIELLQETFMEQTFREFVGNPRSEVCSPHNLPGWRAILEKYGQSFPEGAGWFLRTWIGEHDRAWENFNRDGFN